MTTRISLVVTQDKIELVKAMWRHAITGDYFYDGRNTMTPYFQLAHRVHDSGASLLFTRDFGMHSSGWFRNPDYDRCMHLSIGFFDMDTSQPRPFEKQEAEMWVKLFYPKWQALIWHESSVMEKSDDRPEVHHYRVMMDAHWQAIKPRGEVYSRELTEVGWKSFTEQGGIISK